MRTRVTRPVTTMSALATSARIDRSITINDTHKDPSYQVTKGSCHATRRCERVPEVARDGRPNRSASVLSRAARAHACPPPPAMSIVYWGDFDTGGHFAALETPDLLVNDIRQFFAGLR